MKSLLFGVLLILYCSASVLSEIWETEDTIIIGGEGAPKTGSVVRSKRQFRPFQFPNWPKFPTFPIATRPSCYAASGRAGECVTLKQCFPILYSLDDEQGNSIQNPGLAAMLKNASGPCEPPVFGNYFHFKADAEVRQSFICCSQHKRPPSLFPPLKPTSALPTPGSVKMTTRPPAVALPRPPTAPPQGPRPPVEVTSQPPTTVDTPSSCGISKVVGGTVSGKGRHPWIVALTNNGRQFCGGSLISKSFVLTAAHCVSHMRAADISRIRVHLGEHTLGVGENTEQFEKVTRVLYHRGFSHQTLHNDIALLKLESPARETEYIQPVCLSQETRSLQNSMVTLAGWGQVHDGGQQASTLREVNMQIWSHEACSAKYGHRAPGGIISSMICAGSPGKDACRGDSGGPLTMRNGRNIYEQIGVVSWGIGCGSYPGVYTKVAAYLPWIEKNRKL